MTSSATLPPAGTPGHPSYHKKDAAQCTSDDLKSYDPLTYEVLMVHALALRAADLKKPGAPALDQLTENMLVESLALHFRNLVTFLWPSAPHAKDVYATHFTASKPGIWAGPSGAHDTPASDGAAVVSGVGSRWRRVWRWIVPAVVLLALGACAPAQGPPVPPAPLPPGCIDEFSGFPVRACM